jgi:hypothetical protein
VDSPSKLVRVGAPMLIVVLVLIVAIARVGAGDASNDDQRQSDTGDEYRVDPVTVESVEVRIAESYPVQIFVEVTGYLPDPCWEPQEPSVVQDGNQFIIEIMAERKVDEVCPQVIENYEHTISLGSMDAGNYVVRVNEFEQAFEVQ